MSMPCWMPRPIAGLLKANNTDMPFIPHTEQDVAAMLAVMGADSLDRLFDEIPAGLDHRSDQQSAPALNEMQVSRLMGARAERDAQPLSFIGAGAYEHHVPAAVWQLATRGEFYTAYTPYQAEASQGTLQLIYEYQSMMTALTGMDVSNASLYDGASALAEAVLMAVRAQKGSSNRVLMPRTVSPFWRKVVHTLVKNQGIELVELDYDPATGTTPVPEGESGFAALVVPQPNFFGQLEAVDQLTDWAHQSGGQVIAAVNPLSLALLKPPGQWGTRGADIAVGDGQPLGAPLSNGGPYYGFLTCRQSLVRQMPGRLVGATVDLDGKTGYTLTLQAREQHIRRAKATSNICTNQGLVVAASTIFMSLVGQQGLRGMARQSWRNTASLADRIVMLPGVSKAFSGAAFHETVFRLNRPAAQVLEAMRAEGVLGGFDLAAEYPELGSAILVCATETKTDEDLQRYVDALLAAMERS